MCRVKANISINEEVGKKDPWWDSRYPERTFAFLDELRQIDGYKDNYLPRETIQLSTSSRSMVPSNSYQVAMTCCPTLKLTDALSGHTVFTRRAKEKVEISLAGALESSCWRG